MEEFEKRYEVQASWERFRSGWLARAKDLKLQREVLLCRIPGGNDARVREDFNRLGHAARFSDRRFLHVLDAHAAGGQLYAVLTDDNGSLLTNFWKNTEWSSKEILEKVRELTDGIREARKERLVRYSVTADNIWVDGEGNLRIIDYWTEGEAEGRDVQGLGHLVYQLCARTVEKPSSLTAYCEQLRSTLTDLPGGSAEDAVQWACSAFHPSCTLKEFEEGLGRLLTSEATEPAFVPEERKRPLPEWAAGLKLRPLHLACLIVLFGCIGFIWIWATSDKTEKNGGNEAAAKPSVKSSVGASVTPSQVLTASPSSGSGSSPGAVNASPVGPDVSRSPNPQLGAVGEPGQVPNLVGLSKEDAEKQALQAGLKYQFVMESDASGAGTVFRQDLHPGDTVRQGDKITFWVSKGR